MKNRKKTFALLIVMFLIILSFKPSMAKETPYYTIQIANTRSFNEAKRIFEKIKHLKDSRVDKVKKRYKVRVGLFKTRKEAKEFLKKHPEIKKISPTAYITLNYYDPKRTVLKGNFNKKETTKINTQNQTENKTEKEISYERVEPMIKQNISTIDTTASHKVYKKKPSKEEDFIEIKIKKKFLQATGIVLAGFTFTFFLIWKITIKKRKEASEDIEKPDRNILNTILHRLRDVYYSFLNYLPIKTSRKIIEYHYRKTGDFRSLILLKLQEQDFNFILKETPSYLLKNPNDILVWKIYIEVLGQLGIYDEAANACEKLAKILRKNARPEAAENYMKKAQEYRQKALKLAENL